MALLWKTAMEYGEYHDPDFDSPRPQPGSGSGGQGRSRQATCGEFTPHQEEAIKTTIARDRNYADLGNGKKGWRCHDCSKANGSDGLSDWYTPNKGAPPEPHPGHPGWADWLDEHTHESTPQEQMAKGTIYHTSTAQGIRVHSPEECLGHDEQPHVSATYGEEHHAPGHPMHRAGALYGITHEGLECWGD